MPKVTDVDSLFQATVELFAERGYAAATTQEIAKRAGVNEATLFRRYGTKTALIEAALIHCLANSPFGGIAGGGDVRADLMAIVEAYEATYEAYGGAVLMLLAEAGRHAELRKVLAVLMPNLQKAAQIISAHQQSGKIGPGDPLQKVAFLIAPILASGIWVHAGAQTLIPRLDEALLVEHFLDGHRGAKY